MSSLEDKVTKQTSKDVKSIVNYKEKRLQNRPFWGGPVARTVRSGARPPPEPPVLERPGGLKCIWEARGSSLEAPGSGSGASWEASGSYLGSIWRASGSSLEAPGGNPGA